MNNENTEHQPIPEIALLTANELADVMQTGYPERRIPRDVLTRFVAIMDNAHHLLHGSRLVSDTITLDPEGSPLIPSLSDSRRVITIDEVPPMVHSFIEEQADSALDTAIEQAERWINERIKKSDERKAAVDAAADGVTYQPRPGTEVEESAAQPVGPGREVFQESWPDWVVSTYSKALMFLGHVGVVLTLFSLASVLMYTPLYWLAVVGSAGLTGAAYFFGKKAKRYRLLPKWLLIRDVKTHKITPEHRQRVHGTAGDLSSAVGKFSEANITAGEAGEKATAELLEELAQINGVRIFHGLQWPGTAFADVDHVVMAGTRIAVIDSKMWSGIEHSMDAQAQVTSLMSEEGETQSRTIRAHRAAQDIMKFMGPGYQVRAYLAVHPSDASVKPGFRSAGGTPVAMDSAANTIQAVKEYVLGAPGLGYVFIDDVARLRRLVRSPEESALVLTEALTASKKQPVIPQRSKHVDIDPNAVYEVGKQTR